VFVPKHFSETRVEEIHRLIRSHPLGILVNASAGMLDANHIPFELDPSFGAHGTLKAHVARDNNVWQTCPSGSKVLVIFRGAEAYISPNWYPSKHQTHQQVPTWNYEVVHVQGTVTIRDDERFLRGLLARLTRHHEQSEPKPWKMGDAPSDYIANMLKKIVGIEITIDSLVCKRKLSQNREEADRLNAAKVVKEKGHIELGDHMRNVC
jgi:transcriptional regulator